MRWTRFGPGMRLAWMLGLAVALAPTGARAQGDTADALVTKGVELRVEGRDAEAVRLFREAVELAPDSLRARGQLALALHAVEEWVESEQVMQSVLAAEGDDWVARHKTALEGSLQTVRSHLGWLLIDAPGPGTVRLDEHEVHSLPMPAPLRIVAERHSVSIESAGYDTVRRAVDVAPGQQVLISIAHADPRLSASAPTAVPATAPTVLAQPESKATGLDARDYGMALLGIGATGLVAGAAFGVYAIVQRRNVDEQCDRTGCSERGISLDARGRQAAALSNVFLVAGASSSIAGGVLLWYDHTRRTHASLALGPAVAGGGARVNLCW